MNGDSFFFINPVQDAAYNLALEEVMTSRLSSPAVVLWRNPPSVIVGRNQDASAETDADFLAKHSIALVRRMTGGGAVYHDLGNINYSFMTDAPSGGFASFASFASFARPVAEALGKFGIGTSFSGRNDLLASGRKISGTAKMLCGTRVLFHGTLLFDTDLDMLSQVLTPSPEKIAEHGVRSVRSRVCNLREFLPDMDRETFFHAFTEALLPMFGKRLPDSIPEKLISEARILADAKYRTREWNYGRALKPSVRRKLRFQGGSAVLELHLENGVIRDALLRGDFFGERDASELTDALRGVADSREAVGKILTDHPAKRYLMGIEETEFLAVFPERMQSNL